MIRSWSKFRDDAREYPSAHIRRDNASAFCGLPLPLDRSKDVESFDPPWSGRSCETCYRREKEQRPPVERDDGPPNP